MRLSLSGITLFLLLVGGPFLLHAQTNAAAAHSPREHENWMISFLTPAEQDQYAKARAKALADNPGLEAEGEKVMKQGEALTAASSKVDKQAFIEKMNSHRQKLREAMLKEDPTLNPIFAQIDKHISEMKAKHLTTAPPASGPAVSH